ncbi:MAG: hypothetical protein AAFX06_27325, partial [Planctomycetota bacterium]
SCAVYLPVPDAPVQSMMLALRVLVFGSLLIPTTTHGQTTLRLLPPDGSSMTTVQVEDIEEKAAAKPALPKAVPQPSTRLELKPTVELKSSDPLKLSEPRRSWSPPESSRYQATTPQTGRSLMTIQVEDVEDLSLPDVGPPTQTSPVTRTAPKQAPLSAASRRQQAMQEQLARLRTPISNVRVSGLSSTAEQPPNRAKESRVSQQGFTASRRITGTEHYGEDLPRTTTPYLRRHLYFEDAPLERLGESGGNLPPGWWTNTRSFGKFAANTLRFPLRAWIDRPDELVTRQAK